MIQLTHAGVAADADAIPVLHQKFTRDHWVELPNLLEPDLLAYWLRQLDSARFVVKHEVDHAHKEEEEFGTTLFMPASETALFLFHLLVNRPAFFAIVQQITGCPLPGNFVGRIHRTVAGTNQHIDWHRDTADHRILGLNINLSTTPFSGGIFQLRDERSHQFLAEVGNLGTGGAFLFSIAPEVEHRLTHVTEGSRTVAVGWFRAQPVWSTFGPAFFLPTADAKPLPAVAVGRSGASQ